MMMTVFLKSTVRPWPSVSRPSSRIWSSTLKTSGCAFSISSKSTTRVRPAADRLGQLAALVVADVARRRADQPADGVLLHVLGHVDPDHRLVAVEQELGQRPRQLGLADPGRAEEDEAAERPVRVLQTRPRPPDRVRHRRDRLVLPDDPQVQPLLHLEQLLDLALHQPADRDAGPAADDLGDVLGVDLFLEQLAASPGAGPASCSSSLICSSSWTSLPYCSSAARL